jgi:hypothetical protein
MEDERKQQLALQQLRLAPSSSTADEGCHNVVSSESKELSGMRKVDEFKVQLRESAIVADFRGFNEPFLQLVKEINLLLDAESLLKVYFNNSETLLGAIALVKTLTASVRELSMEEMSMLTDEVRATRQRMLALLTALLSLLTSAIQGQRSAKQVCVDERFFATVKSLMLISLSEDTLALVSASLSFIQTLCGDDVCAKARAVVFSDKSFFAALASTVGNLDYNLYENSCYLHAGTEQFFVCNSDSLNDLLVLLTSRPPADGNEYHLQVSGALQVVVILG